MEEVMLKPCPFCGGVGEIIETTECCGHGSFIDLVYVRCSRCGARGGSADNWEDDESRLMDLAVERWERRSKDGKAD